MTELIKMIHTSLLIDDRPSSFRFPRGSGLGVEENSDLSPLEIGKGRIIKEGNTIAIVNFGARLGACVEALNILKSKGYNPTLMDARFAKPLDHNLLDQILDNHEYVVTIEEGSIGGFSSAILNYIHNIKKINTKSIVKNIIFPDKFIDHNTPENQYKESGMDSDSIAEKIISLLSTDVISFSNYKNK